MIKLLSGKSITPPDNRFRRGIQSPEEEALPLKVIRTIASILCFLHRITWNHAEQNRSMIRFLMKI